MNAQTLTNMEDFNTQEPDLIDVDMPFSAKEIEAATSRRYVEHLTRSDMAIIPVRPVTQFAIAAKNMSRAALPTEHVFDPIDVDMPFSAAEVTMLTSEAYVAALGRSDMPVVGHWGKRAASPRFVNPDQAGVAEAGTRKIA